MSEDGSSNGALLTLLGDTHVQTILCTTNSQPMSAGMLTETCDASRATIYRRVDDLLDHDLLTEQLKIDENGNHYTVYEANLDHIDITLDGGDFEVHVTRHEDAADRITRIWDELRGEDQ